MSRFLVGPTNQVKAPTPFMDILRRGPVTFVGDKFGLISLLRNFVMELNRYTMESGLSVPSELSALTFFFWRIRSFGTNICSPVTSGVSGLTFLYFPCSFRQGVPKLICP